MGKTTIMFTRMDAAALYLLELEGQISDGLYENARPYNHWMWLRDCDVQYSPSKEGYYGPTFICEGGCSRLKKYTLCSLISKIKKCDKNKVETGSFAGDWSWTRRIIGYARFGSCLNPDDMELLKKENSKCSLSCIIEAIMDYMYKNADQQLTCDDIVAFFNNQGQWYRECFSKSQLMKKYLGDFLAKGKYYDYYMNELRDAHNHMLTSVNECLGYSL